MTDIDPSTGESIRGGSPRFNLWVAFLTFSTVTMGSAVEQKKANSSTGKALENQNWAIACSSISFAVAVVAVLAHFHPIGQSIFVGNKVEGGLILVLVAFWTATVSIVSNASHSLAVDSEGAVSNANLYFASWAGFVTSVVLLVSFLRASFGVDVAGQIRSRSARLTTWAALLACQLIVMGSTANIFDQQCTERIAVSEAYCKRTKLGVSVGAIGTAFSLAVVSMKIATASAPFFVEACLSFILALLNGFSVAFITSPTGPGAPLGNIYFFSWMSFITSIMLVAYCFEEYRGGPTPAVQDPNAAPKPTNGEIQVEEIGHDGA